ncbi:MAG: AMP-binding protein, partial [Sciscionella sp.]
MREFSVPVAEWVADDENLTDMVFANAERFPSTVSFRRRVDGSWSDVTTTEFAEQVLGVAKGLITQGLRPGQRIGLMSKTRYEWSLLDFAIWAAGGVSVPIYETSSAEQVEWILSDSGAVSIMAETAEHREIVHSVLDRLSAVERVWHIEGTDGGPGAVDALTVLGSEISDEEVHARRRAVRASEPATVVYTSGTTGKPKGCTLTHYNILAEVRSATTAFPRLMQPGNSLLLFLPLAHVLARVLAVTCVYARLAVGHTADVKNLVTDLGSFRPTFVVAVPRVFEKVYNTAKQRAHAEGKGKIFDAADATAVEHSKA